MALSKDIKKLSGLTVNYIRIAKIAINYNLNQSIITVEEYISEDYRNKARKQEEDRRGLNELFAQLEKAKDFEIQKALTQKIQKLQLMTKDTLNKNYAVSTRDISLDYIPENTTYEGFYNELKKLEDLKDAEMI